MKNILSFLSLLQPPMICCILLIIGSISLYAEENNSVEEITTVNMSSDKTRKIRFHYNNEDLVNIIYFLSELKDVNVILPQGALAIKSKATIQMPGLLSINEAWDLLVTLVDIAGYSLLKKKDGYIIVKKDKDTTRVPTMLYVGVKPESLPDTNEMIRYLYHLHNVKVSPDPNNEINGLLQELLPAGALYKFDTASNGILISAKSNVVRDIMSVVLELDQVTFQEKMELLQLKHTQANIVTELFNQHILKSGTTGNRYGLDTRKQPETSYFSPHVRLVLVEHRNAVIILGRMQAVNRLKDFIKEKIDVEPLTGKSILHTYQLQYLDAESFARVLEQIITSMRSGGAEQSRGANIATGGTERLFDDIIIKSDKPANAEDLGYYGGNKLIIACRNDDWLQIKKLIEDLDSPQPQVLLEVLIADLTIDDTRLLGSLTRNPAKIPILNRMQFQSGQLSLGDGGTVGIVPDSVTDPTTIASDVLRKGFDSSGKPVDAGDRSAASFAGAGTTALSLSDNDGKTWSLMEVLQTFSHSKILSHPHVLAINNKEAFIKVGEERYLEDEATGSSSTTIRNRKPIQADLLVKITPRISSANTVNLQVSVEVSDYIAGPGNARTTRAVSTAATIENNAIFALGGLVRLDSTQSVNETPALSDVPLLGWFFKRRQGDENKNNLTVFISPTIIEPRLRHGMDRYTHDYIDVTTRYAQEGKTFNASKDPISRFFFTGDAHTQETTKEFVERGTADMNFTEPPTPLPKKPEEDSKTYYRDITKKGDQGETIRPDNVINEDNPAIKDLEELGMEEGKQYIFNKSNNMNTIESDIKEILDPFSSLQALLKDEENPFEKRNINQGEEKLVVSMTDDLESKSDNQEINLKNMLQDLDNPFTK